MKIHEGTILTLENGAYSDFMYEGPFVALKTFDQREVCDEFVKDEPKAKERYFNQLDFTAWLAKNGYIADAPKAYRWYLGYTGFNPEIVE